MFKIVTILLGDSLRALTIEFSTTDNRLFKVISNQVGLNIEYIMLHHNYACVLYYTELSLHVGKIVHFHSPPIFDDLNKAVRI